MENKIILTETRLIKNPNTKTTYIVESKEVTEVTERQHYLTTNDDTVKWFRRLGGSESIRFGFMSAWRMRKVFSATLHKTCVTCWCGLFNRILI